MSLDGRYEPSLDEILAYLEGALEGEVAERVRRALDSDPELARAAMEIAEPGSLEAASELDEEAVDAAWTRFNSQLETKASETPSGEASKPPETELPELLPPPRSMGSRWQAGRTGLALFASFCFGVLGSWWWSLDPAPGKGGVVYESLIPEGRDGPSRGSSIEAKALEPGPAEWIVLELQPPSAIEGPIPEKVSMTLRSESRILRSEAVLLQDEGFFVVLFRRSELSPGTYEVELFTESRPDLARYRFTWLGSS